LPTTSWHHIEWDADGSIRTPDCPNAVTEADKIATLVRLGHGYQPGWCGALVALYTYGIPDIVAQRDFGAWRDIYVRYESVSAIKRRMDDVERERDKPHAELFRQARHAFRSAGYPIVDELEDFFRPYVRDPKHELGTTVALHYTDFWSVPLSPTWLADVHALGIGAVGKRMVLGVNQDHPGFVYAIEKEGAAYLVREFFYNATTRQLGAIAPTEKSA
jgi:hypothetical protein